MKNRSPALLLCLGLLVGVACSITLEGDSPRLHFSWLSGAWKGNHDAEVSLVWNLPTADGLGGVAQDPRGYSLWTIERQAGRYRLFVKDFGQGLAARDGRGAARTFELITLLLIPFVIALFTAIRRHYRRVSLELATYLPIDSAPQLRPLVVVPISGWSRLSRQAVQLARNLSDEVHCVHVCVDASADRVQGQWEELVEKPLREAGQTVPRWVVLESPYRRLFTPLLSYLEGVRTCQPDREILVVVGELVENRWYQFFLHNQHAQVLKALLWLHGGRNVAVVSTPWRLS